MAKHRKTPIRTIGWKTWKVEEGKQNKASSSHLPFSPVGLGELMPSAGGAAPSGRWKAAQLRIP